MRIFTETEEKERRSLCADLGKLVLLIFFSPYFLHWWPSLCGAKVSTFLTRFSFLPKFNPSETNLQNRDGGSKSTTTRQPTGAGGTVPRIHVRLMRARRRRHCSFLLPGVCRNQELQTETERERRDRTKRPDGGGEEENWSWAEPHRF
jgi:hypothetical protein